MTCSDVCVEISSYSPARHAARRPKTVGLIVGDFGRRAVSKGHASNSCEVTAQTAVDLLHECLHLIDVRRGRTAWRKRADRLEIRSSQAQQNLIRDRRGAWSVKQARKSPSEMGSRYAQRYTTEKAVPVRGTARRPERVQRKLPPAIAGGVYESGSSQVDPLNLTLSHMAAEPGA
jgi:hypothetical protein